MAKRISIPCSQFIPICFVAAVVFLSAALSSCQPEAQAPEARPALAAAPFLAIDTPQAPPPVILEDAEKMFEADIRRFEALDSAGIESGSILFIGSSSIRKWTTLEADMAPLPVVNRGFGGAITRQVNAYADRIIQPLQPSVIVLYCGENDIANSTYGPEVAVREFAYFVKWVAFYLPETPIVYLAMKPSPARWAYWDKFQQGNQAIATLCAADENLHFIPVEQVMLDEQGFPRPDIFIQDQLHLNKLGYELWTELIRPQVEALYSK